MWFFHCFLMFYRPNDQSTNLEKYSADLVIMNIIISCSPSINNTIRHQIVCYSIKVAICLIDLSTSMKSCCIKSSRHNISMIWGSEGLDREEINTACLSELIHNPWSECWWGANEFIMMTHSAAIGMSSPLHNQWTNGLPSYITRK